MIGCWGKLLYWFAAYNMRLWAKLLFRFKAYDVGNIPPGGVMLASNHVSHLDPPLVGIALKRIVTNMGKKELFSRPFLQWFLRSIGTIMVDRGRGSQALDDAIEYLKRDACIIIFPEGTRSQDGRLGRGRSGVIVLAIKSGCAIVPTAIIGSEKALTKGSKWVKMVPVTVRYGEPYKIECDGDPNDIPRDVLRRETYKLMMKIEAMLPAQMKTPDELREKWYGKLMADEAVGQDAPTA